MFNPGWYSGKKLGRIISVLKDNTFLPPQEAGLVRACLTLTLYKRTITKCPSTLPNLICHENSRLTEKQRVQSSVSSLEVKVQKRLSSPA